MRLCVRSNREESQSHVQRVDERWHNFGIYNQRKYKKRKQWTRDSVYRDRMVRAAQAPNSEHGFGTWYLHTAHSRNSMEAHAVRLHTETRSFNSSQSSFRADESGGRNHITQCRAQPNVAVVLPYFLFVRISHESASPCEIVYCCTVYTSPLDVCIGICIPFTALPKSNRRIHCTIAWICFFFFRSRYGKLHLFVSFYQIHKFRSSTITWHRNAKMHRIEVKIFEMISAWNGHRNTVQMKWISNFFFFFSFVQFLIIFAASRKRLYCTPRSHSTNVWTLCRGIVY